MKKNRLNPRKENQGFGTFLYIVKKIAGVLYWFIMQTFFFLI